MEFSTLLQIVLGVLSIILTVYIYRRTNPEVEIKLFNLEYYSILNSVDNTKKKIELRFDGKDDYENISKLELCLYNNGKKDIDKQHIHTPININFPESIRLIDTEITKSSNLLKVETYQNGQNFSVSWDLLKKDDFILLNFFFGVGTETSIEKIIEEVKVNHRITNLPRTIKFENITKKYIKEYSNKKTRLKRYFSNSFYYMILFLFMSFISADYFLNKKNRFELQYEVFNSDSVIVKVNPINHQYLLVESNLKKDTIHIEQLNEFYGVKFNIKSNPPDFFLKYFFIITSITLFLFIVSVIFNDIKVKRIEYKLYKNIFKSH